MSDTDAASMLSRQRQLSSNEDLAAATPPNGGGGSTGTDVVLSLRDERYKEAMWKQFNILGMSRDTALEETVAVELFTQFKMEGGRFLKLEEGGKRSILNEDEALDKIMRDIKKRTESTQRWFEKSTHNRNTSEVPSVSDNSEHSDDKIAVDDGGPVVELPSDADEKAPPSSVEYVDLKNLSVPEHHLGNKRRRLEQPAEEGNAKIDDAQSSHPMNSLPGDTSQMPTLNDTILSLDDPKYRNAMFKCFQDLGNDSANEEEIMGNQVVNDLKTGGGRFFELDGDGKAYVEVDETTALQRIVEDIGRRSETSKIWNLDTDNKGQDKEGPPSSEVGNAIADVGLSQEGIPENPSVDSPEFGMNEASVAVATESSCPINHPQEDRAGSPAIHTQQNRRQQSPASHASQPTSQECKDEVQPEEKNPDGYRIGPPSASRLKDHHGAGSPCAAKPPDGCLGSSAKAKLEMQVEEEEQNNHGVGSSSEAKLPSEGNPKREEFSPESEETPPVHVILSLNDDHYKETMWRHYRILGRRSFSVSAGEREVEIGMQVLSLFKQKLGDTGKFFKRVQNEDVEVDDERALAKIIADIRRRMKNYKSWEDPPEMQATTPGAPSRPSQPSRSTILKSAPQATPPSLPVSRPRSGRQPKKSSSNEISPRRTTRKNTPSEASRNKEEPGDEDVILSMSDERYKEIMWRKYNILGKKDSRSMSKEEVAARQIFSLLKRSLGRGGNFFRKLSRGDKLFVVDDGGAVQKIFRDLKRRNETIHKWKRVGKSNTRAKSALTKSPPEAMMSPQEVMDHSLRSIEKDHAWRDQLAPSPIEMVTNYRHEPSTHRNDIAQLKQRVDPCPVDPCRVDPRPVDPRPVDGNPVDPLPSDMNPVDMHTSNEKPPYVPNHGRNPRTKRHVPKSKVKIELLKASHLGQRLPPLKTIPSPKSVRTPNQLIQMLQHATHKLNELNGTHAKHCKVLRLYHLPEFNESLMNVVMKAPTLVQLAKSMGTTAESLTEWYAVYQNAISKNFDFEKFGEDMIDKHNGAFFEVEQLCYLSKCGEKVMEECFFEIGKRVVEGIRTGGHPSHNTFDAPPGISNGVNKSDLAPYNNDSSFSDHKSPFLLYFETNKGRLLDLKNKNVKDVDGQVSAIELCTIAKRVKRGVKERMLCMVLGCEKHAQTRCDGCCTAHFRLLSSTTIKPKKKRKHARTSTSVDAKPSRNTVGPRRETSNKLRKRKARESDLQKRKARERDLEKSLPNRSILNKLETGSRIFVEWNGDDYKATVKKKLFDREVPMLKVHYDGKKRHILDTIPVEMVKSLIKGETPPVKQNQTERGAQSSNESYKTDATYINPTNSYFPSLQQLYPGVLPSGKEKITQPCPELGIGWHVHIVSKRTNIDGLRIERYFTSPTGKKFCSDSEVEMHYQENPIEFGSLTNVDARKSVGTDVPKFKDDERLDHECQEVSTINQRHLATQLGGGSFITKNRQNFLMTRSPEKYPPISARNPKIVRTRSTITISPITTVQYEENDQSSMNHDSSCSRLDAEVLLKPNISRLGSMFQSQANPSSITSSAAVSNCFQSPKEVAALNSSVPGQRLSGKHLPANRGAHFNSAVTSPARKVRPPLRHKLYQTPSVPSNVSHHPGKRSTSTTPWRKNELTTSNRDDAKNERNDRERPKRMPKPVTRFDEEDIPSSRSSSLTGGNSKSVLCHCPECDKRDMSVQGIYAHYGRAHSGKLLWQTVTFSCPFCSSSRSAASQTFKYFTEVETHVRASHRGCNIVGPHPSKLSETSIRVPSVELQAKTLTLKLRQDLGSRSDRVLRERKTPPETSDQNAEKGLRSQAPQIVAQEQGHPLWNKIEYVQLLPDGRKEYPRDLCRVIDMINEQCQAQEEIVEVAQEQRMKLCRNEAELETRALNEERLSYSRGVRERMRLADGERIEKQKFIEKAEHMMMQYQYENRNKRRNQEDIEVEKLLGRPIRFSKEALRHNTRHGKACKDEECPFCKKDKGYLHHLLLDDEMSTFEMGAPALLSPVFQQSTNVLNPSFRIINDEYFLKAEAAENLDAGKEDTGGKRVNQSRRDASTAKRLKMEEDKLLMLKNTKHSLEFIEKYNSGMIANAWGEMKKDNRGRKSY